MAKGSSSQVIAELIRKLADHETTVELQSLQPGHTAVKIVGPTREAVQHQMEGQFELADQEDCLINFNGPFRFKDGHYIALGEIISWGAP